MVKSIWNFEDKIHNYNRYSSRAGYSGGNAVSKSYTLLNVFDTSFHVYGIGGVLNTLILHVDDVLYNQITPANVSGEWVLISHFISLSI
jgi:hypothetical protein